jgi:uncharacterized protein (TIGR00730 family)
MEHADTDRESAGMPSLEHAVSEYAGRNGNGDALIAQQERLRQNMRELFEKYVAAEHELAQLEDDRFRVCIFGSARIQPEDPIYHTVQRLAQMLASLGIDIVTGGGPGLMEAANQGEHEARVAGVMSIGLPILLPHRREMANRHLDIKSEHSRFSSRLDEFMRLSHAVIVAPGGIGTLLELAYTWQLIQVGLIKRRPMVLLGSEYWDGLLDWIRSRQLRRGLIGPDDIDIVQVANSEADVLAQIRPALEKFMAHKRAVGAHEKADEALCILEHVDRMHQAPQHREALRSVHNYDV